LHGSGRGDNSHGSGLTEFQHDFTKEKAAPEKSSAALVPHPKIQALA
jgi:hypothetical protein